MEIRRRAKKSAECARHYEMGCVFIFIPFMYIYFIVIFVTFNLVDLACALHRMCWPFWKHTKVPSECGIRVSTSTLCAYEPSACTDSCRSTLRTQHQLAYIVINYHLLWIENWYTVCVCVFFIYCCAHARTDTYEGARARAHLIVKVLFYFGVSVLKC